MQWRKVSVDGARTDYGVVIVGAPDHHRVDEEGTATVRALMSADVPTEAPFFDRGPGYARLADGRAFAEVDRL